MSRRARRREKETTEQLVWCETCNTYVPTDHRDAVASAVAVTAKTEVAR